MMVHEHRRSWIIPAIFIACLVLVVGYVAVVERVKQERAREKAATLVLLLNKMDYIRDMRLYYRDAEGVDLDCPRYGRGEKHIFQVS